MFPSTGVDARAFVGMLLSTVVLQSCDGNRDELLAMLQSGRAPERATAIQRLSTRARPEDLIIFTQAAKDPSAFVRAEAATALGRSQDPRVVDILGELLGDSEELVQERAARALASLRTEKARSYLTMQYARRSTSTRRAIVAALKSAGVTEPMSAAVSAEAKLLWDRSARALAEGTLPERIGAAQALGQSGRPEAVDLLLPLLGDSQVMLVTAVVRGLGAAGDPRAIEPITRLLTENHPELRLAACEALAMLGATPALDGLRALALEGGSASQTALQAILALPPSEAVDKTLCVIAAQGSPTAARRAGRFMRDRDGCPLEPIAAALKSRPLVALAALEGLGPKAQAVAAQVTPLLSHSNREVRRSAAEALAELGEPTTQNAVQAAYDEELKALAVLRADWIRERLPTEFRPGFEPNGEQASAIAGGAGSEAERLQKHSELERRVAAADRARLARRDKQLTEPRPPAELVDDASDDHLALLSALLQGMGQLGVPDARSVLKEHLDDASLVVRRGAVMGLGAVGPEDVEQIAAALRDEERVVQRAAAQALTRLGAAGEAVLLETMTQLTGDRAFILEALSTMVLSDRAIKPLTEILGEGGDSARIAATLLGKLKAVETADLLMKYLEDPLAVGRPEVLLALGAMGSARAVPVVERDLYHDSAQVRAAAARALALIAPGHGILELTALKHDYFRSVREEATVALSRTAAVTPREASR